MDVDRNVSFRWAKSGQWILSYAHLDDKANEHHNSNSLGELSWLNDESKNIYPSVLYSRYWDSTQQTYATQTGSESYIDKSTFKNIHGLDLATLEFEVINNTPDITPPKFNGFDVPDDTQDGVLDISNGEILELSGDVTDYADTNTVSGFSQCWITLRRSHEYDSDGNRVEVTSPDNQSDYISLYISGNDSTGTGTGNTIDFNSVVNESRYKFKNEGDYVFYYADIYDKARNRYYYSKRQSDYDKLNPQDENYTEASANQVKKKDQDFLAVAGIDVNSSAFNFRVLNSNVDEVLPTVNLEHASQIKDGVLDIPAGESSALELQGTITDLNNSGNPGSGLSSLSLEFEDVATQSNQSFYLSPSDLDGSGKFKKTLDFSNEAPGTWRITYAYLSDKAGNSLRYSIDWNEENQAWDIDDDNKARFKELGLDFDQWEFTLKNDDYDNLPPQGTFTTPDQLSDGVLDLDSGETSSIVFAGTLTDQGKSGVNYLSINLKNINEEDDEVYIHIPGYILNTDGLFSIPIEFKWKSGTYRPSSAYFVDNADNKVNVSSNNLLSANQIIRFKQATGIDLSSNTFNFEVKNSKSDYIVPQAKFNVPEQLSDGILDISAGEAPKLEFTGLISDGTGSGLSYVNIRLEDTQSDHSFSLNLYKNDLNSNDEFLISKNFEWKTGSYSPVSASISDEAGNNEYLYRNWSNGNYEELTAEQIEVFKEKTSIDLSTNTFNFAIKNDNPDTTVPQVSFNQPEQLADGILNLNGGEDSIVEFTGSISDGTGSGFESLTIRLTDVDDSSRTIYLGVDDDELKSDGSFKLEKNLKWKAGTYRPSYAFVEDKADNQAYVSASWSNDTQEALTTEQVESFKTQTGIDLSSTLFNFTIENDNADTTQPQAQFDVPAQLKDGVLDLNAGESGSVVYKGIISDGAGSGLDNLSIRLINTEDSSDTIYLSIDEDELGSDNTFTISQNLQWKTGTYRPSFASIQDNADNEAYIYSNWSDGERLALTDKQIEDFEKESGIDLSSKAFNFSINNDNPDISLPQANFNVPTQLLDGKLDLNAGESPKLRFTGSVLDGTGSGLEYLTIQLRKQGDKEQDIYLYIDSDDIRSNGSFSIIENLEWDEGTYAPYYASIEDKAGNYRSVYASDSSNNYLDDELTILQIQEFKEDTGIDLSSLAFNFSIENDNADSTVPQGRFDVPEQLSDGVLDIVSGESAQIKFSGQFEKEETGSLLNYFYIELYNEKDDKIINLSVDNYELDEDMSFEFYYDASWDSSGKYTPRYASLSDEAGNYVSAYSDDQKLTDKEIADFKKSTGIDLSSNTFNFTVNNSKADTSPPLISGLSITGENLSLINGVNTLSLLSEMDSSVKVNGTVSDEPAGFDHLWIELLEKNSGATISRYIDSYDVDSDGNFEIEFDFQYLRAGEWILGGLDINDRANNEAYYWTDGKTSDSSDWQNHQIEILKEIGVNVDSFNITVQNENTDITTPEVSNVVLNYDPNTSRISFNGDVTDDLSGFDYLWLRLENKEASEHFWLDVDDWTIDWNENEDTTQTCWQLLAYATKG